jgi:hypothetical protein
MMVAGMSPRMPPPSMLNTVTSFPVDGGGCGTSTVGLAMYGCSPLYCIERRYHFYKCVLLGSCVLALQTREELYINDRSWPEIGQMSMNVLQIRRFGRAASIWPMHLVQPGQSPPASDEMESPLFSHTFCDPRFLPWSRWGRKKNLTSDPLDYDCFSYGFIRHHF